MPDAKSIEIADAIVDALEAFIEASDKTATVKRTYSPRYDPSKDGNVIFVIPASVEIDEGTREADQLVYGFGIGVYAAVNHTNDLLIDSWVSFSEQVCDHFRANDKLDGVEDAFCLQVETELIFDPGELRRGAFLSVVRVFYTTMR